jgi:hypothetical protein
MSEDSTPTLTEEIVQDALRKVKDPEAGINIVDRDRRSWVIPTKPSARSTA